MKALEDIGDDRAEPGTEKWSKSVLFNIQIQKRDVNSSISHIKTWFRLLQKYSGWRNLRARDGAVFDSFEAFCMHQEPEGAGMPPSVVSKILSETDKDKTIGEVWTSVEPMPEQEYGKGKPGPGRGNKTASVRSRLYGETPAYLAARIKRDAPDIAEAAEGGQYRSVREAAIAAGIAKKRMQAPTEVRKLAAYLRERYDLEDRKMLATLLME